MPNKNDIELNIVLNIVVNGRPEKVKTNTEQTVRSLMEVALAQSGNSGQPIDNWELREPGGQILDPNQTVGHYNLQPGATLFLNLKAGIGG
jgi:hypothetical protein